MAASPGSSSGAYVASVIGVPDPTTLPVPFAQIRAGHQLVADGLAAAVGVELGADGEQARQDLLDVIVDGFLHRRRADAER